MVKSTYFLFLLFIFLFFCFFTNYVVARNGRASFHVGVVLDLTSNSGQTAKSCVHMAFSDFYKNNPNYTTRLVLHFMDSANDVVAAASSALYLIKDVEVQAIIGPQQSTQASFVIDLGEKAHVPVMSFSATSPSLSPLKSPYFIRTAIDDSTQVKAIAAIIQAFKWKEVVLIYEDTNYGNGFIPYSIDAFQEIDVHVPYRSKIPLDANDDQMLKELHKLRNMQTRVYIVYMSSSVGSQFFINVDNAGMLSQGYAWIVSDGLSSLLAPMDSNAINSMEGVLGVIPYIPKSKELEEFKFRWKRRFLFSKKSYGTEISEPSLYGIWAYDTVWALAMAIEGVGTLNPHFLSGNTTSNLTDLSGLGYSPIGPRLLHTIQSTRFKGLSGDFHLVNGQLEPSAFQIFNMIGGGKRVIGNWTQTEGLRNLRNIIWPGISTIKPKGWTIVANGTDQQQLKVLVPIKAGFNQFARMEQDPFTKETNVTGFCIDVFRNVTNRLPFGLSYQFQPYPVDGKDPANNSEFIHQFYNKNWDAVVGDITILLNRSNHLDFTIPYSGSGVVMVVPMKDDLEKQYWMFVKPLSLDLWLATMAGFIYIGFIVWILEYPTNTALGATHRERLQASLWFSFLTLVFAQREKIENNLTKVVLITWVFFVLIITQSYTANLSSILAIQQLQPKITDVSDLRNNGYSVGYQDGSFVKDFLIDHLKLDKFKLKSYNTPEDYHYALSKGTYNGGVAAIFDEIPYINIFLNMYCNKYTQVGRTYSSEGFGFVFPKGSPLVSYMSMAILNITDDGTLDEIKQRWLENQTNCNKADASSMSTNQLTIRSFGGLFFIIGGISGLSLLIHLLLCLQNHIGKAKDIITIINTCFQGELPEVGSMESQPRGTENMEEGIVEEAVQMKVQRRGVEDREEGTVEGL